MLEKTKVETMEFNEVEANENEVEFEEEESKIKKFGSKAMTGIKKHGKTVAVVAGVLALGVLGYALGQRTCSDDSDAIYDEEHKPIDSDCVEMKTA